MKIELRFFSSRHLATLVWFPYKKFFARPACAKQNARCSPSRVPLALGRIYAVMATSVNVERVLLTDNVDVSCKEALEAAGIGVEVRNKMTKDELLSLAPVNFKKQRV